MRWKLLIITSLVVALIGVGGEIALAYWLQNLSNPRNAPLALIAGFFVVPLVLVTLAGIFVYRRTARRRKLQAALTVILSLILTLAALLAAQLFL